MRGGELGCRTAEQAVMVERENLDTAVYWRNVSFEISSRGASKTDQLPKQCLILYIVLDVASVMRALNEGQHTIPGIM